MPSKTETAHDSRLARGTWLKKSLEIIAAGDARNRGGSEKDWAKACEEFSKQEITAPSGSLRDLERELANRIDVVTGGPLGGERIRLETAEAGEEIYLAIRGGPEFDRLLCHIRIKVAFHPHITLANIRNSIPTPHTILVKASTSAAKADFHIEAEEAERATVAAVAIIAQAEKDFEETLDLAAAVAPSPKATEEALEAAEPLEPLAEAARQIESGEFTSGATAAEAVASESPKPKRRKSRPKSKVAISKQGAGK